MDQRDRHFISEDIFFKNARTDMNSPFHLTELFLMINSVVCHGKPLKTEVFRGFL